MPDSLPTYYDVLQVERHAPPERVRAAWRRLAQKYHPDKLPGNANAVRAMAAINAAYDVLSDQQRRAEHDAWIRRSEQPTQRVAAPQASPATLWAMLHPARHWAWYVLGGTVLVVSGTFVTAVYLTAMPARAAQAARVAVVPAPPATQVTADARRH